jgi:hypothetical protein
VFNTHTTTVIARVENLGPLATLSVHFNSFEATPNASGVALNWTASGLLNHDYFNIERSEDGIHFTEISRFTDTVADGATKTFSALDERIPAAENIYYRIRQCNKDGQCRYSAIKTVKWKAKNASLKLSPVPVTKNLVVSYASATEGMGIITITDLAGKPAGQQHRLFKKGNQSFEMMTQLLPAGSYFITITNPAQQKTTGKFIKL